MKKPKKSENTGSESDDLLPEYRFDYSQARPNRFAGRIASQGLQVTLDQDVSEVFTDSEVVNRVLRALIAVMPATKH